MAQSSNESMNSPIIETAVVALSADFNKLFDLHIYNFCHDVTVLSREKQEIKAHKFILAGKLQYLFEWICTQFLQYVFIIYLTTQFSINIMESCKNHQLNGFNFQKYMNVFFSTL